MFQRLRKLPVLALPALVLLISAGTQPIAFARDGATEPSTSTSTSSGSGSSSGSGHDSTTPTSTHDSTSTDPAVKAAENEAENETTPETKQHESDAKERAKEIVKEARKDHKTQTHDERVKNCESHKKGLDTKLVNLAKNAQKHQAHIADVMLKVESFKTTNSLNVANFDKLVAAATAAQAQSLASVNALSLLNPDLVCANDNVATDIATFKAAAEQTHKDLLSFRQSVKDLLTAVAQAADTTKEGQQ